MGSIHFWGELMLWAGRLAVVSGLLGVVYIIRQKKRESDQKMVEDFVRTFPGRCMICSFRRYGISHGFHVGDLEPHDCIEGNVSA